MARVGWEMADVGAVGGRTLIRVKIDYLGSSAGDGGTGIKGWMIMVVPPSNRRGNDRKTIVCQKPCGRKMVAAHPPISVGA